MDLICLEDIINNKDFWLYFFSTNFPNAYDEESNITLGEYINDKYNISKTWVNELTKYYKEVFDLNDGYVDEPKMILLELNNQDAFKIEFHPGDTIYYLNDKKIGCTGPDFMIHNISWEQFKQFTLNFKYVDIIMFLILPMVYISKSETDEFIKFIEEKMPLLPFDKEDSSLISNCMLENLIL